jgi:hypothetical protein
VRYQKTLVLLVDHTNFLKSLRDDVISNGCPPLPAVISPTKMPRNLRKNTPTTVQGSSSSAHNLGETFEDMQRAEEDENSQDSDW